MIKKFNSEEAACLLAAKGVGPTVIKRFEEIGIHSLQTLAQTNADDIAEQVASMLGSSCWKNSPQSKAAINAAISAAKAAL